MEDAYEPSFFVVPLPPDYEDERSSTVLSRAATLVATAEDIVRRMRESHQPLPTKEEITQEDLDTASQAFTEPDEYVPRIANNHQAMILTGMIAEYDMKVIDTADQIRNICINIMLEKAMHAKTDMAQLKAVELLGKVKDVGLFEERSTVVIENMDNKSLQQAIKEKIGKIKFLLNEKDAQDVTVTDVISEKQPAPAEHKGDGDDA